ncbi:MAG: hypothetical protein JWQ97_3517 [Phenylobacterium sp.]|nr:hypothetical protein [Phenylobacterium sp.]
MVASTFRLTLTVGARSAGTAPACCSAKRDPILLAIVSSALASLRESEMEDRSAGIARTSVALTQRRRRQALRRIESRSFG